MSLVVRFAPTGLTKAKYDSTIEKIKAAGEFPTDGSNTTSVSGVTAISRSARFGTRRRSWTSSGSG